MSKALVIKNADFSQNKVTTVVFNDIPCTGVAFLSSSVTLSALGEAEIAYTITPANTTDAILLVSSDPTVVSVSGTTLTVVGIGSCVLTLTCGSHSATCNVTVDIYENPEYVAGVVMTETNDGDTGLDLSGSSKRIVAAKYLSDTSFTLPIEKLGTIVPNDDWAPIPIPSNASKIHIECSKVYNGNNHGIYFFEDTDVKFQKTNYYTVILSSAQLPYSGAVGDKYINTDVSIPTGAMGYIIGIRQDVPYNNVFDNCTTEAEVKQVVETNFTPSIHYLTE